MATVENGARTAREAARVEAFSDGVFAIAVMLLILEIPSAGGLLQSHRR